MRSIIWLSAVLLTVSALLAETKVYKGTSTYSGDCIVTFRDGRVYKGNSTYSGDCIMTFSGDRLPAAVRAWLIWHFYLGWFF